MKLLTQLLIYMLPHRLVYRLDLPHIAAYLFSHVPEPALTLCDNALPRTVELLSFAGLALGAHPEFGRHSLRETHPSPYLRFSCLATHELVRLYRGHNEGVCGYSVGRDG